MAIPRALRSVGPPVYNRSIIFVLLCALLLFFFSSLLVYLNGYFVIIFCFFLFSAYRGYLQHG